MSKRIQELLDHHYVAEGPPRGRHKIMITNILAETLDGTPVRNESWLDDAADQLRSNIDFMKGTMARAAGWAIAKVAGEETDG